MEKLELGSVIKREGSLFEVLGRNGDYVLCRQTIEGLVVAYEVSKVVVSRRLVDFATREYGNDFETIPKSSRFGMNLHEKSFTQKDYHKSVEWLEGLSKFN